MLEKAVSLVATFILQGRDSLMVRAKAFFLRHETGVRGERVTRILIIWLAPSAGKMNQILPSDWLPEWPKWSYILPARDYLYRVPREKFPRKPYNSSVTDQFGQDGLILASFFFASLWTSTPPRSRSISTQKKDLANIQPS